MQYSEWLQTSRLVAATRPPIDQPSLLQLQPQGPGKDAMRDNNAHGYKMIFAYIKQSLGCQDPALLFQQ
jgi:hypothetical protein